MNAEREWVLRNRGHFTEKLVASATFEGKRWCIVANGFENYPEPQYYTLTCDGKDVMLHDVPMMNYDEFGLVDMYRRSNPDKLQTTYICLMLETALDSDERIDW